ncbi:hypothetical protein BBD42_05695 [Paenibacillus sp. BIHB 4019]|uniref:Uncharacterized protein n=1 Tax=Paenibacillus sp. BIHB 4019 TaxID=1870819 RepID=A0A1B2DE60_9BACL|nr:hypothetical protein [Paenibacillus sp. BIHB 4019]ANY66008.1 hypothetical protein BBD42_05695 [Paenibacillus sp. BIHB 4019]
MSNKKAETIRTMKYRYTGPKNGIGYSFSPIRYGEAAPDNNRIFIYDEDFSDMLPFIKQKYPLADARTGEVYDAFDPCWDNPIPKAVWQQVVQELDALSAEDPGQLAFIHSFTAWVREVMEQADEIVIYGNL